MEIVEMLPRLAREIVCAVALVLPLACCGGPGIELPPSAPEAGLVHRA